MTYYKSAAKYEREKLLKVLVKFNRNTEPDLVAHMEEQPNRAGYLKRLVKEDLERGGNAQQEKE